MHMYTCMQTAVMRNIALQKHKIACDSATVNGIMVSGSSLLLDQSSHGISECCKENRQS